MAAVILSEQEIRADFAQRLIRRFEAMRGAARCSCGANNGEHSPSCVVHCWGMAARAAEIILDEENGADGE